MEYILIFIVVFVTVTLIKWSIDKKKRANQQPYSTEEQEPVPEKYGKIAELSRKMEEKAAWMEADTQRMKDERARRKATKQAEKQARIEFKSRNK